VIDPVSAELELRAHLSWPWRPALAAALALHALIATALLLVPVRHARPLLFPSVLVRFVAAPVPAGSHAGAAATPAVQVPVPSAARVNPRRASAPPTKPAAAKANAERAVGAPGPPSGSAGAASAGARTGHGIGVDTGAAGEGESFPFAYYLERVVAAIEQSWFKPAAAADTHCRVLCRIERSGRLVEAGLEEASAVAAFDRAALRAVYAASPFPPLPQAYTGAMLTLHLEFGP
jgi:TonB family protein